MELKKGDIILVESPNLEKGSEIKKTRPCIIVSPAKMAQYAHRLIIVPLTSNIDKIYPFEALINSSPKPSKACCDQIQTISIKRVLKKYGHISFKEIVALNYALRKILDI